MSGPPQVTITRLAGTLGQPVVVLGPSLGTRVELLWGAVARRLVGADVVGWNLPGHGHSPATSVPFDLADLASAVLTAIEEHPGLDGSCGYHYAGDSIGGAVGLQLGLTRPERLLSLTVACSAARFGEPTVWLERSTLVRTHGMSPLLQSTPGRWFGSALQASPSAAAKTALNDLLTVDAHSYALVCEALAHFDILDRLHEITTPLLAIAGADDVATPADTMQTLAQQVRQGRLAVLRGVGHLAPLEDPPRTAGLLNEHISHTSALPTRRD